MAEINKAWWNTGSTLGTIALGTQVLGGFGGNGCGCGGGGGGLLGNLFGGNNNNNCEADHLRQQVAGLQSVIAKEQAERYADGVGISAYKDSVNFATKADDKINANFKELAQAIVDVKISEAKTATELSCFQKAVGREFEAVGREFGVVRGEMASSINFLKQNTECAIGLEAERRCCGDNSIVTYSNATFYPKAIAGITTTLPATPQQTYNPLPKCCGCAA